jgi:hypothetical protein
VFVYGSHRYPSSSDSSERGPVLCSLPCCAILAEHLLVQGTASALVPLHLCHQGANHLERFRVLLPVVVACQVEPTEHLLPLVERTVQVLHGSTEPEDDLVTAFALPFLECPGAVLERMGFPIEAPKGRAGCHECGGGQRLLAKGGPGLPDFVQRHPQGRERRKIRKRRGRSAYSKRSMLLSLFIFAVGTDRVSTKGVSVRVDDGVFQRDNERGVFLLMRHDRMVPSVNIDRQGHVCVYYT